jgi:hypothetical protein
MKQITDNPIIIASNAEVTKSKNNEENVTKKAKRTTNKKT